MRKTTALAAPLAAATLVLLTACGPSGPSTPGGTPPAGTSAGPSTTSATLIPTTPAPTPTEDPLAFTVDGVGPYQLGVTLTSLQASGLLAEVSTGGEVCSLNTHARGTGEWTDVRLSFRQDGILYLVVNRSPAIETPSGAALGNNLATLNTIYASATHEVLSDGFYSAFLVRAGAAGRGILFDLGSDNAVFTMAAADATYLHDSYVNGTDFC